MKYLTANAPDTGNMEVLYHFANDEQKTAVANAFITMAKYALYLP
ncbi:hypothetical protein ACOBV9_22315 (plasmid) [Pseudoalteromonas espejiana]